MRLTELLMNTAIDTFRNEGNINLSKYLKSLLEDHRNGIGHRKESDCR